MIPPDFTANIYVINTTNRTNIYQLTPKCYWTNGRIFNKRICLFYNREDYYHTLLYVTRLVSYQNQQLLTISKDLGSPWMFSGFRYSRIFSLLCFPFQIALSVFSNI